MPKQEPLDFAELPESFLDSLAEFTYGGFILFYFDAQGRPRFESTFNEPIDAIALQKFALDTLSVINSLAKQQIGREIAETFANHEEPPTDDEEDDDGESEQEEV